MISTPDQLYRRDHLARIPALLLEPALARSASLWLHDRLTASLSKLSVYLNAVLRLSLGVRNRLPRWQQSRAIPGVWDVS
jgi:hypothetical protein